MLISKNWLRDFVFLPDALDAVDLARRLSLSTVEVEKLILPGAALDKIVVGKIEKISPHPDADKLKVCLVDVGEEKLSIVCGGSNLTTGMNVAVAKLGASVCWHGEGEPVEIVAATIRGIESRGMICASDEIGLLVLFPKKEEKEIIDLSLVLSNKVKVGTPLAVAIKLDDVIFDIDNKSLSNRPDLWGHYGLAREVATLTRKKLKEFNPPKIKSGNEIKITVKVEAPELCSRYLAVAMTGVSAGASPDWLKNRLETVGQRSINAIVDLTNYVMLELGQPLHAFDAKNLNSKTINVCRAKAGEKFVTLDDKEYVLSNEMLVIADAEKNLALAGVKGGKNSGVSAKTDTIIFEAANFDAASIRRTSTALGLRTDSSARFEKSLDPYLPELALRRVVELTQQIFPNSRVVSAVTDIKNLSAAEKTIETSVAFINDRSGLNLDQKTITNILEQLGFEVVGKKNLLKITVPSWRVTKDITIPEDIVEEVVRMYGYDKIPSAWPRFMINPPVANPMRELEREVKKIMAFESGMTEVSNYSFVGSECLAQIGLSGADYLALDNPMAKDRPWLRQDLFPGLVQNIISNKHGAENIRLFEIGRVFKSDESGERVKPNSSELLPDQPLRLGMTIMVKNNQTPFFLASHSLYLLSERLGFSLTLNTNPTPLDVFHPGRQAAIMAAGKKIGVIGELHPRFQSRLGIIQRVALVELSLSDLLLASRILPQHESVSEFPSVRRDIAFEIDRVTPHRDIKSAIVAVDPFITEVELFDVYEGKNILSGKKSMAYHISYQASDRTLITENADLIHKKIEVMLKKQFKIELR